MRAELSPRFDLKLVLAYAPSPAPVLPETTPDNWLKTLVELCSEFDCNVRLEHFNKHVGISAGYTHKAALIEKLQIIYHRLTRHFDSTIGKLSENGKISILMKLTEEIKECTPGFLNRVNLIIYSMTLPSSLPQLMCRARKTLVELAALPYDGSHSVHTANYFTRAGKPHYGIEATFKDDVYAVDPGLAWLDDNIVLAEIASVFERDFTPLNLLQLLCDELRSGLCQLGYENVEIDPTVGKRNYTEDKRIEFETFIYKCLNNTINHIEVTPCDMYWKIEYDDEGEKYYVDLDWDFIRSCFQRSLKKFKYVDGNPAPFSLAELIEADEINVAKVRLQRLLKRASCDLQAFSVVRKQLIAAAKQNHVQLALVAHSPDVLICLIELIDFYDKEKEKLKWQQQSEKLVELSEIVELSLSSFFTQDERVQQSLLQLRDAIDKAIFRLNLRQIARVLPLFYIVNGNHFKNNRLIDSLKDKLLDYRSIVSLLEKMPDALWIDFLKFIQADFGRSFPYLKTVTEFLTEAPIDLACGDNLFDAYFFLGKLSEERANALLKILYLKTKENQAVPEKYQICFSLLLLLLQEKIASADDDSENERSALLNHLNTFSIDDWCDFLLYVRPVSVLYRAFDVALEESFASLRIALFNKTEFLFARFPNNRHVFFDKLAALAERHDDARLAFSQLLSCWAFFNFVVHDKKIHDYVLRLAIHYSDERPEIADAFLRNLLMLPSIVEPHIRCYDVDIKLGRHFSAIFSSAQASENRERQLLAINILVSLAEENQTNENRFIVDLLKKLSASQLICFFNKITDSAYKKIKAMSQFDGSAPENFEEVRRLLIMNLSRFNFEKKEMRAFSTSHSFSLSSLFQAKNFAGYNALLKALLDANSVDDLSLAIAQAHEPIRSDCFSCFGYADAYQERLSQCDETIQGFQRLFQKRSDIYREQGSGLILSQSL